MRSSFAYAVLALLLSLVCILALSPTANAIIATPDSNGGDMPPPPDSFVYPWGPEASGFAISPTALLTSAHGGGGAWGYVIGGQFRMFCTWTPHPSGYGDGLDIGVATLCPGQPPFTGFYKIYRGELSVGDNVVIAGSGISRGAPLFSSAMGGYYGYADAPYNSSLIRPVVYAMNRIFSVNRAPNISALELATMYDGPNSGRALPYEGSVQMHDSGGLLAVVKGSQLQAAGIIIAGGGGLYTTTPHPSSTGSISYFRLLDRADVLRWLDVQVPDASICVPDLNGSGSTTIDDVFTFLRRWFQHGVDWNGDGTSTNEDLFLFLQEWFGGCQ